MNWLFVLYGFVVVLIDAFGVWKPRAWIEWTERQFVYRRERVIGGASFILLGVVPIYWILTLPSWQFYVLAVLSGFWIILGLLLLGFPEGLRAALLAFAGLDDKVLRWVFIADAVAGLLLVLIGVLV